MSIIYYPMMVNSIDIFKSFEACVWTLSNLVVLRRCQTALECINAPSNEFMRLYVLRVYRRNIFCIEHLDECTRTLAHSHRMHWEAYKGVSIRHNNQH